MDIRNPRGVISAWLTFRVAIEYLMEKKLMAGERGDRGKDSWRSEEARNMYVSGLLDKHRISDDGRSGLTERRGGCWREDGWWRGRSIDRPALLSGRGEGATPDRDARSARGYSWRRGGRGRAGSRRRSLRIADEKAVIGKRSDG
ncbi:hypothetical protein EVAR_4787_1 [Eumeta japonica]|uniref:Uncharacterized protein n=1 Tax=Eumeta variegata TaxID=151549 RepID=A0A4C1SYZ2_EUMVA|nr:hypothetical protein EVAR_4787_1 [Eumeta japonica]